MRNKREFRVCKSVDVHVWARYLISAPAAPYRAVFSVANRDTKRRHPGHRVSRTVLKPMRRHLVTYQSHQPTSVVDNLKKAAHGGTLTSSGSHFALALTRVVSRAPWVVWLYFSSLSVLFYLCFAGWYCWLLFPLLPVSFQVFIPSTYTYSGRVPHAGKPIAGVMASISNTSSYILDRGRLAFEG